MPLGDKYLVYVTTEVEADHSYQNEYGMVVLVVGIVKEQTR